MPTTDVTPSILHNLVGWDILTADGWQTIQEARNRGLGDKLVTTDETEPGREWVFGGRPVQVRAPREAVELVCGHPGVPGAGRGRRQDHGFCWFGCFKTLPVKAQQAPDIDHPATGSDPVTEGKAVLQPNAAQLAVLIHYDGGPTPQEQGRRPTADTIKACWAAGWLEASAEQYPRHRRTTADGVAAIRSVLPDYVSPGTAPRPTALGQLRMAHPDLAALLAEHAAAARSGDELALAETAVAERIAAYVLALAGDG